MPATPHEYQLVILEHHLDTFGHVNNATYLKLFEEARWDWITSGGYGLNEVRELAQGPTILQCTVRFKRELTNRQRATIRSSIAAYRGKLAIIRQQMLNEQGQVCCEAEFIVGLFDLVARKLVPPTERWLKSVGLSLEEWQAGFSESVTAAERSEERRA